MNFSKFKYYCQDVYMLFILIVFKYFTFGLFYAKIIQNYKVIKMINEEIKKLRKSLNLSQEDFGSILGVAQRTVSAWEAGNNEPSISILILIFKKWGITPSTLILGENEIDILFNKVKSIATTENKEKDLIDHLNVFICDYQLQKINSLVRSFKGSSFAQKLGEAWNGDGERMLIVLYYFIEYIDTLNLTTFDKLTLIDALTSFSIPKKIQAKHLFTLKEQDKKNLIEWVNKNLDDLDAGTLLADLPKTKEFIKSELNYINRFLV